MILTHCHYQGLTVPSWGKHRPSQKSGKILGPSTNHGVCWDHTPLRNGSLEIEGLATPSVMRNRIMTFCAPQWQREFALVQAKSIAMRFHIANRAWCGLSLTGGGNTGKAQAQIQDFGQGGPAEFGPQGGGPEPKVCSK